MSIIIPAVDHAPTLATCLGGLFDGTEYADFEVILVDAGSAAAAIREWSAQSIRHPALRVVQSPGAFNVGKACNAGVRHATGELILLLSHDIEVLHADWLTRLTQWLEIPGVGIVGPTMLRPDGRLHDGGVVVGLGGLASGLFAGDRPHADSIFGPAGWYRNLSAVSGACLLTSRTHYDQLGGLDERFRVKYSDVDFCLRTRAAGYRVVFTPDARLVSHESPTHRRRVPRADVLEATRRFQPLLERSDPFFNPNLSCRSGRPTLRIDPADTPRSRPATMA